MVQKISYLVNNKSSHQYFTETLVGKVKGQHQKLVINTMTGCQKMYKSFYLLVAFRNSVLST